MNSNYFELLEILHQNVQQNFLQTIVAFIPDKNQIKNKLFALKQIVLKPNI